MGINLLEVEVGNPATPEVTECKTCKTGRFHFYELNTKRALIQLTLKIVELAARYYEAPRPYKGEASQRGYFVHIVPLDPDCKAGLAGHVPANQLHLVAGKKLRSRGTLANQ